MIIYSKSLFFQKPSGGDEEDYGDLSLWNYSNDVIAGKTLLYEYNGDYYNRIYLDAYSYSSSTSYYLQPNTIPTVGANVYYKNGVALASRYINYVSTDNLTFRLNNSTTRDYTRNTSADNPLNSSDPKTIYVPKAGGKAIVNNYTATSGDRSPFNSNQNVIKVDFQYVPYRNNNMYGALRNCIKLREVTNINNKVSSLSGTFFNCTNFNYNIQIPNSVTTMSSTFSNCTNFNQNIQIPNSVTNMSSTFSNCTNFNQNIQIPNSVTNMSSTFSNCTALNSSITIGNSVTNMSNTFLGCTNFNQSITIPNNVTNMYHTFFNCTKFNQDIQILNGVTTLIGTFYNCSKLAKDITIPESVTIIGNKPIVNTTTYTMTYNIQEGMFYNCNALTGNIRILSTEIEQAAFAFPRNNAYRRNVYIYFQYANGVNTQTYNTFKSRGGATYDNSGDTPSSSALSYNRLTDNTCNTYIINAGLAPW